MTKKYFFFIGLLSFGEVLSAQITVNSPGTISICDPGSAVTLSATYTTVKETTSYTVSSISDVNPYSTNLPFSTSLTTDDSWSSVIDLKGPTAEPFNFCFFGNTYSKCLINTNGVISFSIGTGPSAVTGGVYTPNGGSGYTLNQPIPYNPGANNAPYLNAIHGVFQDTNPTSGVNINYYVDGIFPNRKFVFSMIDVPNFSCSTVTQSSQIVLHEGTNIIDVYVIKRDNSCGWQGGKALLGIQNQSGTTGYTPVGRNTGSWSVPATSPEAWRFTPNGNTIVPTLVWTDSQGTVVGNGSILTVNPVANEVYTVTASYADCNGNIHSATDATTVEINEILSGQPINLQACASDSQPVAFDLTQNNALLMNGLDPTQYYLTYHTTFASADGGNNNEIPTGSLSGFLSTGQTIFARIEDFFSAFGCYEVKSFELQVNMNPSAPTGSSNQSFVSGETLADIELTGTNIQWYGSSTGSDLLPNSTLLVDGMTYYASQTNAFNCESRMSPSRFAVTVNNVLSNQNFVEPDFKVYPNPVKDVLNLSYATQISSVTVYNLVGQEVLSKNLNAAQSQLDMSNLSAGTYIVKVNVDGLVKTIKVVKQ